MTGRIIAATALAGLLVACGGQTGAGNNSVAAAEEGGIHLSNASVEEVATAARENRSIVRRQPGQWEETTTIESFNVPGLPADQQAMLRQNMQQQQPHVATRCVTQEEADSEEIDIAAVRDAGQNCRYERMNLDGGRLDAVVACTAPTGAQMRASMNGTYSATASDIRMQMHSRTPAGSESNAPQGNMDMTMRIVSRRTGDCTAAPAEPQAQ